MCIINHVCLALGPRDLLQTYINTNMIIYAKYSKERIK